MSINPYELLRHEHGLSVDEVAKGSGLSSRTIIRLERGPVRPNAKTIKALADFYRVSVAELAEHKERA